MRKSTATRRIKEGRPVFQSADEMLEYLVEHCNAKRPQVNALKSIASGDKTWKEAVKRYMKDLDPKRGDVTLRNQLGTLMVHLVENMFYDNDEAEKIAPAAKATVDVGQAPRGRKPRSKNRPKDAIESDRLTKEISRQARIDLGFGNRGRLSAEQSEQLKAKIIELIAAQTKIPAIKEVTEA